MSQDVSRRIDLVCRCIFKNLNAVKMTNVCIRKGFLTFMKKSFGQYNRTMAQTL